MINESSMNSGCDAEAVPNPLPMCSLVPLSRTMNRVSCLLHRSTTFAARSACMANGRPFAT